MVATHMSNNILICYLHVDTKMNEIIFTGSLMSRSIVVNIPYIPKLIFNERYINMLCKSVCLELKKTQFIFNDYLLITNSNNKIAMCIKNNLELHLNSYCEECSQNKSENKSLLTFLIILILFGIINTISNKLLL